MSSRYLYSASRFLPITALVLAALLATGCGSDGGKVRVSGTVTYQGEPVEEGYITFYPAGGAAAEAGKIEAGNYSLLASPGKSRIEIFANRQEGFNQGMNQPNIVQYLPKKYNDETTLSEEVVAGEQNVFNFDLTE